MQWFNEKNTIRVTTTRIPTFAVEVLMPSGWVDVYFSQDEDAGSDQDRFFAEGFDSVMRIIGPPDES